MKLIFKVMKKVIFAIAIAFAMLVVATGYNQNPQVKKVSLGSKISHFDVKNDISKFTVGENSDKYTLLILWKSSDAKSRIACSEYSAMLENSAVLSEKIDIAAINFDKSEQLFNEIIRVDNLDASMQYRPGQDILPSLNSMFSLDKGMGTVLISPDGTAISYNPTHDELMAL